MILQKNQYYVKINSLFLSSAIPDTHFKRQELPFMSKDSSILLPKFQTSRADENSLDAG